MTTSEKDNSSMNPPLPIIKPTVVTGLWIGIADVLYRVKESEENVQQEKAVQS